MLLIGLVAVISTMLLVGCDSIDEKRGYSEIPQNRPSDWELNPMANVPK